MVKIRLTRMGRNKLPYYRIVVVDSRNRRDGSYIELLGHYEPFSGKIDIKKEEAIKWLNNGAQPSETLLSILKKEGIWKDYQNSKIKKVKKNKRKISSSRKNKKLVKNKLSKDLKNKKKINIKVTKDDSKVSTENKENIVDEKTE